jgi:hypothetical protein
MRHAGRRLRRSEFVMLALGYPDMGPRDRQESEWEAG